MTPLEAAVQRLENVAVTCDLAAESIQFSGDYKTQLARDVLLIVAALKAATEKPAKARLQIPPAPADVAAYSLSIGYPVDGQKWCDFYAAKGWMIGRSKMRDWQAAVRNWKTNGWGDGPAGSAIRLAPVGPRPVRDYSKF